MSKKYGCGERMVDGVCESPHLCDVCQGKMIEALEDIAEMPPHGYGARMASTMADIASDALVSPNAI